LAISKTEKMLDRKEGGIGWITFNNPARLNAVSIAMWEGLNDIVAAYEIDPEVRVIVVEGAGDKAFVSGADISEFAEKRSSPEAIALYNKTSQGATDRLKSCSKPTIAMIRGYCIGGGLGLALSCDVRLSTDAARFGVPAAKLGLGYDFEGVRKLVNLVGPSFAKEIFFTARQFSAEEALVMGLINRAVPVAELDNLVQSYAQTICENAPLTISSIKTLVNESLKDESVRNRSKCEQSILDCFNSLDYIEGRTAFMEKRKPKFKGC